MANLTEANLTETQLSEANLEWANLTGADTLASQAIIRPELTPLTQKKKKISEIRVNLWQK